MDTHPYEYRLKMFVNEELRGIINMRKEKKYKTSWEGGLA
jgi:hypothetical protein